MYKYPLPHTAAEQPTEGLVASLMEVDQGQYSLDLVGGPFAVIESDPGVFTSLTRLLGIKNLELVELYDIEPWAVDHLNPHGLIFCFMWRKDAHRPTDFDDPATERVWFANQLSDDACATHAILNVLLNCPHIDIGDDLRRFRAETEEMSPVMRGLAITNSPIIRPVHNSLARPSDLRASLNNLTITTFDTEKKNAKAKLKAAAENNAPPNPPPAKRAKTTTSPNNAKAKGKAKSNEKAKEEDEEEDEEETYHFIGYVPAHGKVWELDGLKSGPLEVGELPLVPSTSTTTHAPNTIGWMDIARPALRMKMSKYGGLPSSSSSSSSYDFDGPNSGGGNIRFSLLAIVDDAYTRVSHEWEFLKREKVALERKMQQVQQEQHLLWEWEKEVDPSILLSAQHAFTHSSQSSPSLGRTFSPSFGARKLARDMEILNMSSNAQLVAAWEECIRSATQAKVALEDELAKGGRANTDHIKRTHDYEPFVREYITRLHNEGLLNALLDRDGDGKKKRGRKAKAKG